MLCLGVLGASILLAPTAEASIDWPQFQFDASNTGTPDEGTIEGLSRIWNTSIGEAVQTSIAVSGDRVFLGSWDGALYALDRGTGEILWRFQTEGKIRSAPVLGDGRVSFGSEDGNLYTLEASSGEERWRVQMSDEIRASPVLWEGLVIFGTIEGSVHAHDSTTGDLAWRFPNPAGLGAPSPVSGPWRGLSLSDGALFYGTVNGSVVSLDAESGALRWIFSARATSPQEIPGFTIPNRVLGVPAVDGGTVYASGVHGYLYALDTETGNELWRRGLPGFPALGPTTASGGVLVPSWKFASEERPPLTVVSTADGSPVWTHRTETWVTASVAALGERVLAPTAHGELLVLDLKDGHEVAATWLGHVAIQTPPTIVDGVAYIGDDRGNVHAFSVETPGPSSSGEGVPASRPTPPASAGTVLILCMSVAVSYNRGRRSVPRDPEAASVR